MGGGGDIMALFAKKRSFDNLKTSFWMILFCSNAKDTLKKRSVNQNPASSLGKPLTQK